MMPQKLTLGLSLSSVICSQQQEMVSPEVRVEESYMQESLATNEGTMLGKGIQDPMSLRSIGWSLSVT